MVLRIPDISQHQTSVDLAAVRTWAPAVILRAHNGNRVDPTFTPRRKLARQLVFPVVGAYHYLVEDRDAAVQAHEFAAIVGPLLPNEFVCLDVEADTTGPADAMKRGQEFLDALPYRDRPVWVYSGQAFWQAQGLDRLTFPAGIRRWVARYSSNDPDIPYALWQSTSAAHVKGVLGNCDVSEFPGTVDDLMAMVRPVVHADTPQTAPTQEDDDMPLTDADRAAIADAVWARPLRSELPRDNGGSFPAGNNLVHAVALLEHVSGLTDAIANRDPVAVAAALPTDLAQAIWVELGKKFNTPT